MVQMRGLGGLVDNHSLQLAREALTGLSRRQGVVANNIANIDTPGYQRRAVDFESALTDQAERLGSATRLRATDERHIAVHRGGPNAGGGATSARDVVTERNDANSVSIDEEMTLLAETQLRYQALTQTVGRRLSTMRTVIRGQ